MAAPKKDAAKATVKVQQIRSAARRTADQEGTLVGLGLNKQRAISELEDTPAVRGMIYKIRHLVKVIDE